MKALKRAHAGTHLPRSIAALGRLGQEIDRRWATRKYGQGVFPALAAEALRAASYHQQFDEEEVAEWVHRATALPRQFDPRRMALAGEALARADTRERCLLLGDIVA